MPTTKPVFFRNLSFCWLYLLWFTMVSIILLTSSKSAIFLFINHANHPFFDIFFTLFTFMGDGIFILLLGILLIILKYKKLASGILGSYALSGLLANLLKQVIESPRPAGFFPDIAVIHTVNWMELFERSSFPSGHTTSIFALAVTVSLFSEKKYVAVLSLIIATVVGYSRVYLGNHFVLDVWAGSLLGVLSGFLFFILQQKYFDRWLESKK